MGYQKINWNVVICDTIYGAINGAFSAMGMGTLGSAVVGASLSGLQYLTNTALEGNAADSTELFINMGLSFLGAFIPGTGFDAIDLDSQYYRARKTLLTAQSAKKLRVVTQLYQI